MKKALLYSSALFISLGLAGIGGAVDLAESPKAAIVLMLIGILLAFYLLERSNE